MENKDDKFVSPGLDGKNVDPQFTVNVKNPELEEVLREYAKDKSFEKLNTLVKKIRKSRVLVPAAVGPKGQPLPLFLKTPKGESFLAIYTELKEMRDTDKIPAIINMPYEDINKAGADEQIDIVGIAINPFTDNMIFKKVLLQEITKMGIDDELKPQQKTMQLTQEQYRELMRKQYEFNFLPKKLFEKKGEFIAELTARKEEFIDELYEESYSEKRMYPYLPEDFSVMVMDISEDLCVISVDFPNKDFTLPCCQRVYITWNSVKEDGKYFTVEYTPKEDVRILGEMSADQKHFTHNANLVEGSELQQVIDLHKAAFEAN